MNKHWDILKTIHSDIDEFSERPLLSYRRPPNLADKLVKSYVGPKQGKKQTFLSKARTGSFPCLSCVNCSYMAKVNPLLTPERGLDIG